MKAFSLSIALICASSMYAGKKDRAAAKAEQKKIDAQSAATLAAIYKANAATSQHDLNCKGPNGGGCWKCNSLDIKQQSLYDKK